MAWKQIAPFPSPTLADLLPQYLAEVGWSERQLAQRANIPRGTVRNWCKGAVAKPRQWQPLIRAAAAMRLSAGQTNELLQVAGHMTLNELGSREMNEADRQLLAPWAIQKPPAAIFQAIHDLPYFVGRTAELAELKGLLLRENHPTLYVISGMGGVGKTSLAARLAYEVRDFFTDGILWARVDTSETMSLLKLLADAYDTDVSEYTDLYSRSQAVRTILATKKALLVLDNVESSQQVEHLLPPTGPCAVLLTTRHTNLHIARGCPRVHLMPFPQEENTSQDLFAKILGQSVSSAERETLAEIADLLGHYPMALAIIAGRLANEPHATAARCLAELKAEKGRLAALTHEDQSVQASFNTSFTALSPQEQYLFSALGVFGGEDFSLEAVTAVAGLPVNESRTRLIQLYNLSLVQAGRNRRYQLHPLLREYARAKITDPAIYMRTVAYFTEYVQANSDNFRALEQEKENIITAVNLAFAHDLAELGTQLIIDFSNYLIVSGSRKIARYHLEKAEQWARKTKDVNSLALVKCAQGHVERLHNPQLAQAHFEEGLRLAYISEEEKIIALALKDLGMFSYDALGEYEQARNYWQESMALARKTGQHKLLGDLINYLASVAINLDSDYRQAEKLQLEGLALQRENKNWPTMCMQLMNLSMIAYSLGNYQQSEAYLRESEAISEQIGYRLITTLLSRRKAALLVARSGDYESAWKHLQAGEQLAREINHLAALGFVLAGLGDAAARLARFDQADRYLQESLQLARRTNRQDIEIENLTVLGYMATQQRAFKRAEILLQKALSLARSNHDVWFLASVLEEYGEYLLARQDAGQARDVFDELLPISLQSEFLELVGLARFGLARAACTQGKKGEARRFGEASLETFRAIGHFRAQTVRAWLGNECS